MDREIKNSGVYETAEDLTVFIFTFDNSRSIAAVLDSFASQELDKIKVVIIDNESWDGTPEQIQGALKNKWYLKPNFAIDLDIKLITVPRVSPNRADNIVNNMKKLLEIVDTPFFMRIDSDILLSPNSLKPMLAMFKENENLSMLALRYCPKKDHIPTDCTMFRTEDARKVVWQWGIDKKDGQGWGCDCVNAFNQLNGLGKDVMWHPDLRVRHVKFL